MAQFKKLQEGFPALIYINSEHNHTLDSAESLSYLRPSNETRAKFETYFDGGMGIKESCDYHESKLELKYGAGSKEMANALINSKYRTVRRWHDKWREANLGPRYGQDVIEVSIALFFPLFCIPTCPGISENF